MTPWLSDFMRKWVSVKPQWTANNKPSSIATISAHPMLRPSESQPGENFQASHVPLKTKPTPHDEEASTQNSTGDTGGGLERIEPQKLAVSWDRHQVMSVRTLALGVLRMKGDDRKLKEEAKRDRDGSRERPSGTAREQWTRVPKTDSTSFLANLRSFCHGSSFSK